MTAATSVDLAGLSINEWFVVFHETTDTPWIGRLAWGRFKHVSAFGYALRADAWVRIQYTAGRLEVFVAPGGEDEKALLQRWCSFGPVLRAHARLSKKRRLGRLGLWCVPLTAHLVGVDTCALRPDRLWDVLIANGAVRVDQDSDDEEARGRPGDRAPAEDRAAGEDQGRPGRPDAGD